MTTEESFFSLLKAHRKSENIDIQDIAEYTKNKSKISTAPSNQVILIFFQKCI